MNQVVCIGELLVDFFTVDTDVSLSEAHLYVKKAGGAPANVCATIARLGGEARFCGKVGRDGFGRFLEETLIRYGVDTRYLMKSDLSTTLAFVTRQQGGERDFVFQRGADGDVTSADLAAFSFEEQVAHFGSATALLSEPFRGAYIDLMGKLRERGTFISFDPNFRDALWAGREADYLEAVKICISLADFVKMSEEEYALLQHALKQEGKSIEALSSAIFAITLGEKGTKLMIGKEERIIQSIVVDSVDTTGAGDAFVGGMLYQLANEQLSPVREQIINRRADNKQVETVLLNALVEMVKFANIVGAFTCTKVGAMDAIPTLEDVIHYIRVDS